MELGAMGPSNESLHHLQIYLAYKKRHLMGSCFSEMYEIAAGATTEDACIDLVSDLIIDGAATDWG